jgi:hypothetical protein
LLIVYHTRVYLVYIVLQIRAQLAAIGTPIIGDSAYMTAAMAAMANPSINPFGREKLSYNSEEEKEAAIEAWIAAHGKEPKSVIGLQASEISWDYEGEHHSYKAGVPWWRQDSVESDLWYASWWTRFWKIASLPKRN